MAWKIWNGPVRKQAPNYHGVETWYEVEARNDQGEIAFATGTTRAEALEEIQKRIHRLENPQSPPNSTLGAETAPQERLDSEIPF